MGWRHSLLKRTLFFEKMGPTSSFTWNDNGKRYESLLWSQVIPTLQQRIRLDRIIFMQDGTSLNIAKPMIQLVKRLFRNDKIISSHFPTVYILRSSDLIPYDFCLRGYHKNVIFSTPSVNSVELKPRITQHIHNVTPDTLQSVAEHSVYRFKLAGESFRKYPEHVFFYIQS